MAVSTITTRSEEVEYEYTKKLYSAINNLILLHVVVSRSIVLGLDTRPLQLKQEKVIDLPNMEFTRLAVRWPWEFEVVRSHVFVPDQLKVYKVGGDPGYYALVFTIKDGGVVMHITLPPQDISDALNIVANLDALDSLKSVIGLDKLYTYIDMTIEILRKLRTFKLEKPELGIYYMIDREPVKLRLSFHGNALHHVDVEAVYNKIVLNATNKYYITGHRMTFILAENGYDYPFYIPEKALHSFYTRTLARLFSTFDKGEKDVDALAKFTDLVLDAAAIAEKMLEIWKKYESE